MHHTIPTASGREIHPSINPALAGFDRALRRTRPDTTGADAGGDERADRVSRRQLDDREAGNRDAEQRRHRDQQPP